MQICLDIYFLNYIFLCFCIESSACPGDYSDKYLSNRLFLYLNICFDGNIQPAESLGFRCSPQSAPVRSAGFFHLQTVVILHREQPYPRKQHRGILKTLGRDSPARIFPIAKWKHLHVVSLRKDLHEYDRSCPYCGFVTRLQTRKSN